MRRKKKIPYSTYSVPGGGKNVVLLIFITTLENCNTTYTRERMNKYNFTFVLFLHLRE